MSELVQVLGEVFSNPIFTGSFTILSFLLSWYLNTKRVKEAGKLGKVIASLQGENAALHEENARLRDKIDNPDFGIPTPSRARVAVALRNTIQAEDVSPDDASMGTALQIALGGYVLSVIAVMASTDGVGLQVGVVVGGGLLAIAIGMITYYMVRARRRAAKFMRIRHHFQESKLTLKEIDDLRQWISTHPMLYFSRVELLRLIQVWAHESAQTWVDQPSVVLASPA